MIIVTGGAGFIGSNLINALNQQGITEIVVVDNLENGTKFVNLADLRIQDYLDKKEFIQKIKQGGLGDTPIEAIFHLGACSVTTEWNGAYMMENNFEYSKQLLHYSLRHNINFIYASSAAVYGTGRGFKEEAVYERPLNVYGYSKLLFDQYVRRLMPDAKSQIVGLRYFNVYGPREQHKQQMASVVYHLNQQMSQNGTLKLFEGSDGYAPGEQRRDFVYVGDVTKVNLWCLHHPHVSGIFNLGTGKASTFNQVAQSVIAWHQKGQIDYIPFPEHLKGHYQSYTQANLSQLRAKGCDITFKTVEQGVKEYLDCLHCASTPHEEAVEC